jgi:hypothetical protein
MWIGLLPIKVLRVFRYVYDLAPPYAHCEAHLPFQYSVHGLESRT